MTPTAETLRREMQAFVRPSTLHGAGQVVVDLLLYCGTIAVALLAEPTWLRVAASILAGALIAGIFVLAHDAAHNNLTPHPKLNRVLAFLCLAPSLHNYTLWRIAHNSEHHRFPNVRGQNSWTPLSLAEYRALPWWRRGLERFYRSGVGFGLYYLVHRWWAAKFLPLRDIPARQRRAAMLDAVLLLIFLVLWGAACIAVARFNADPSPWLALLYGIALPLVGWGTMMGSTVYWQHTHPKVPWFTSEAELEGMGGQEAVTVSLQYWRAYAFLTHEIMDHHAHHINPLIPHYRLHAAEMRLRELCPDIVVEPFTLREVLATQRICKLYDYEKHQWLDFAGRVTAQTRPGPA